MSCFVITAEITAFLWKVNISSANFYTRKLGEITIFFTVSHRLNDMFLFLILLSWSSIQNAEMKGPTNSTTLRWTYI